MTVEDLEKGAAALVAWRLQKHNCLNGMLAILFVIRARMLATPDRSWLVQVGAMNEGAPDPNDYPDPRDPQFLMLLQLVDGVYDGTRPDSLTDGALWFSDPGLKETAAGRERVAQVGTTTFYK